MFDRLGFFKILWQFLVIVVLALIFLLYDSGIGTTLIFIPKPTNLWIFFSKCRLNGLVRGWWCFSLFSYTLKLFLKRVTSLIYFLVTFYFCLGLRFRSLLFLLFWWFVVECAFWYLFYFGGYFLFFLASIINTVHFNLAITKLGWIIHWWLIWSFPFVLFPKLQPNILMVPSMTKLSNLMTVFSFLSNIVILLFSCLFSKAYIFMFEF